MIFKKISIFAIAFYLCVAATAARAQGLAIQRSPKDYVRSAETNPSDKMVELKSTIPGIVYDLRYATTNNFMHRLMYPKNTKVTFLRKPAAEALARVQEALMQQGRGLKIFDAYRPWSVTRSFWELVKDERYVANPAGGSNHNRGTAVDLTIIDLKTGLELPMGTGFDNFTDTAHHTFTQLPAPVLSNRELLKSIMEKNGFKALATEWWHYTYTDGNRYEVMDIPFKKLKRLQ